MTTNDTEPLNTLSEAAQAILVLSGFRDGGVIPEFIVGMQGITGKVACCIL